MIQRNATRAVRIGRVIIGDHHPIAAQSMCATPTTDVDATLAQLRLLEQAGADIVRIAADNRKDAQALIRIRGESNAVLSVDLQENLRLAEVIAPHVDKIRYNPGHLYHHERKKPWKDKVAFLVDIAGENELQLLLENEKGVVGDIPERCLRIMRAIDLPQLRFIWDPANFVQCGAVDQVDRWWDELHPYTGYIHIKDARLADNSVTVAGDGDGQLLELLTRLRESGYQGVLSLEPHLLEARHSSGFSGADGMAAAVDALRKLMAVAGIEEG